LRQREFSSFWLAWFPVRWRSARQATHKSKRDDARIGFLLEEIGCREQDCATLASEVPR
jgi:hypothetical protein